jgi:hypothetical protein
VKRIERLIGATRLNLAGRAVLTEAATGAYCVTPVIAAMAGANEVVAYTRDSRFGKIEDVVNETKMLINSVDRPLHVNIVSKISPEEYSRFDIITNSGHLRPINREQIMKMKPTAVIPLMYEGWELRKSDLDLLACRERGVRVAGTNEHNTLLNVFDFLGPLVGQALQNVFVPVVGSRIVVISNNAFGLTVARYLSRNQAEIFCVGPQACFAGIESPVLCGNFPLTEFVRDIDACVVATTPSASSDRTYDRNTVTEFVKKVRPATCVHLWGDIDYKSLIRSGICMVPSEPVPEGHQGLAMGSVGPEPIISLIVGGFKVAEVLANNSKEPNELEFCQFI